MDRRELLQLGAAAAALNTGLAGATLAQGAARKNDLSVYTRTLNWLKTPEDVAGAVKEIGSKSVDLIVRRGSNHVDPEKVKTEMPRWVNGLKANGVSVSMIAPTITEATDPYAEDVLDAAAQAGIHHYWWGTWRYDETKPYWPQLDALKPKVEALVKLNEKYGMKAMAHPRDGAASVSAAFYDLYYVLKDFDPRFVSFQYDTHHLMQAFDGGWVQQLRMGAPYIGGFVWKDVMIEMADSPNPDDAWRAAHPRPPRAGTAAAAGGPAGAPGAPGAAAEQAVAGGRGGGGFGGGRRGGGGAPNTAPSKVRIRQVPVGTGMINLKLIAQTLKEINFNGPMEWEPEWPQLGGGDQGAAELSIPRADFIALMKRDRVTLETIFSETGLI
jgi:sugar phosphate isomerase/epimerase